MIRFVVVLGFASLLPKCDAFVIRNSRCTTLLVPTPPASSLVALRLADSSDDDEDEYQRGPSSTNVLGTSLVPCCENVRDTGVGTGFYRDGFCSTGQDDLGRHTVCVQVTDEFLTFSASVGNDLSTPAPQYLFPGLREGDIWCLCAERWAQACGKPA